LLEGRLRGAAAGGGGGGLDGAPPIPGAQQSRNLRQGHESLAQPSFINIAADSEALAHHFRVAAEDPEGQARLMGSIEVTRMRLYGTVGAELGERLRSMGAECFESHSGTFDAPSPVAGPRRPWAEVSNRVTHRLVKPSPSFGRRRSTATLEPVRTRVAVD